MNKIKIINGISAATVLISPARMLMACQGHHCGIRTGLVETKFDTK